jgi:hypothetical protein
MNSKLAWILTSAFFGILIGCAQSIFVWNHFYESGPYLLDSAWYSTIIHKAGAIPTNPPICHPAGSYFDIHVSLYVSFLSLASSLLPVGRIPWYVFNQGLIYALMAVAPAWLAWAWIRRAPSWFSASWEWGMGLALMAGTSLSGTVLSCWGYPHYEILIPAMINLALVALVMNRLWWCVGFIGLAAGVREDGGFQAALAFFGVWLWLLIDGHSDEDRPPTLLRPRLLIGLTGLALLLGTVCMVLQKSIFHGHSLLREEYLGNPLYSHISFDVLRERLAYFRDNCRFIYYPLCISVFLTIAFRSWIPVMGWIAFSPWLFFNFFAVQDAKWQFSIYSGFPFAIAMFLPLVLIYYRHPTPPSGWFTDDARWLRGTVLCCLAASTIGFAFDKPGPLVAVIRQSTAVTHFSASRTHAAIDAFFAVVKDSAYLIDPPAATLAMEHALSPSSLWRGPQAVPNDRPLLFSNRGMWARDVNAGIAKAGIVDGWQVPNTLMGAVMPQGQVLPAPWEPVNLLAGSLSTSSGGTVFSPPASFIVNKNTPKGFAVWGPYLRLEEGNYLLTWKVTTSSTAEDLGILDVASKGNVLARAHVGRDGGEYRIPFAIPGGGIDAIEFRYWNHGECPATLTFIDIVHTSPDGR